MNIKICSRIFHDNLKRRNPKKLQMKWSLSHLFIKIIFNKTFWKLQKQWSDYCRGLLALVDDGRDKQLDEVISRRILLTLIQKYICLTVKSRWRNASRNEVKQRWTYLIGWLSREYRYESILRPWCQINQSSVNNKANMLSAFSFLLLNSCQFDLKKIFRTWKCFVSH